jgi:hypothetical protein
MWMRNERAAPLCRAEADALACVSRARPSGGARVNPRPRRGLTGYPELPRRPFGAPPPRPAPRPSQTVAAQFLGSGGDGALPHMGLRRLARLRRQPARSIPRPPGPRARAPACAPGSRGDATAKDHDVAARQLPRRRPHTGRGCGPGPGPGAGVLRGRGRGPAVRAVGARPQPPLDSSLPWTPASLGLQPPLDSSLPWIPARHPARAAGPTTAGTGRGRA